MFPVFVHQWCEVTHSGSGAGRGPCCPPGRSGSRRTESWWDCGSPDPPPAACGWPEPAWHRGHLHLWWTAARCLTDSRSSPEHTASYCRNQRRSEPLFRLYLMKKASVDVHWDKRCYVFCSVFVSDKATFLFFFFFILRTNLQFEIKTFPNCFGSPPFGTFQ